MPSWGSPGQGLSQVCTGRRADWDRWGDPGSPPALSLCSVAEKNPLAPCVTPGSSSLSSRSFPPAPRQALSRQHLCLNDFNECNQFLGCFCCCFQYLCCCSHYFLVRGGEHEKQLYRVTEDFLAEYCFSLYFVLGT